MDRHLVVNPSNKCSRCGALGKEALKKCSGCRLVKYCSRECQRQAWPTHKKACRMVTDARTELATTNPAGENQLDGISKWLSYWRGTLFEFALYAMDLANHPRDRMATHIVLMEFTFRPNPKNTAQYLQYKDAFVMPRADFIAIMRAQNMPQSYIDTWAADARGPDILQINLAIDQHMRTLWAGFPGELERFRNEDKLMSHVRAQRFAAEMQAVLESGQPRKA